MRVLMISKACVVGIYQPKLEEMAAHVDLTVVVPPLWNDPSGPMPLERAYTRGYRMLVEPMRFNGNFHLYFFPTLGRIMRELRPDAVHIDEEPYNFATWHALWLAKRFGAKALFFSWQNIRRRYPFPFAQGEAWTLRTTDHAIMGTESAAAVWRAKGYCGPYTVIPQFGVSTDIFPFRPPAPGKTFTIGYIGRLVPEKGVDLLIRALAELKSARLKIIGQGPMRQPLEALARELGVAQAVEFVGQVPSTQMSELYSTLDALVLPSRTLPNWKEQFGRVLIEAMACGVPVIGSDCGAIPDVLGDAGLVFPENDPAALAQRLHLLITDSAFQTQLAERGRVRIIERFTHRSIAAQTVEVYRAISHR